MKELRFPSQVFLEYEENVMNLVSLPQEPHRSQKSHQWEQRAVEKSRTTLLESSQTFRTTVESLHL